MGNIQNLYRSRCSKATGNHSGIPILGLKQIISGQLLGGYCLFSNNFLSDYNNRCIAFAAVQPGHLRQIKYSLLRSIGKHKFHFDPSLMINRFVIGCQTHSNVKENRIANVCCVSFYILGFFIPLNTESGIGQFRYNRTILVQRNQLRLCQAFFRMDMLLKLADQITFGIGAFLGVGMRFLAAVIGGLGFGGAFLIMGMLLLAADQNPGTVAAVGVGMAFVFFQTAG